MQRVESNPSEAIIPTNCLHYSFNALHDCSSINLTVSGYFYMKIEYYSYPLSLVPYFFSKSSLMELVVNLKSVVQIHGIGLTCLTGQLMNDSHVSKLFSIDKKNQVFCSSNCIPTKKKING